jgi:hypothetical protein
MIDNIQEQQQIQPNHPTIDPNMGMVLNKRIKNKL